MEQAPHAPIDVIDTPAQYERAIETIRGGSGPIAIDAERASGYRYSQRAYLIQIFRRDSGTFLFDPTSIGDFSELNSEIRDTEWVFHAASQDLECLNEVGLNPHHIFDTELGARLAGLARVGLGSVVEELLGIHLAKEHSAADWSTRPLPQPWLVYAALDVELLIDLRDAVAGILQEQGKTEIARQEFDATLHQETKPANPEAWRRLSGLHSIRHERNLAIARALWIARDTYAQEIDTAPGRLLPDNSITAAAKTFPATRRELAAMKDFNGRASRSQLPRWWAAIEAGASSTDLPPRRAQNDSLPPARAWSDKNPAADQRLVAARLAMAELSEKTAIPVENLLKPALLRQLAWEPPEPITTEAARKVLLHNGARAWQCDATVQLIVEAFVEADQKAAGPDEPTSWEESKDS